jgi:glyoxylase-like metal-dependent hydrolase (beta-lactamase superfamily II)
MTLMLHTLVVGRLETNCYLVGCARTLEGAVIDPGDDARDILAAANALGLHIGQIILTHFHFDHVMGALAVQQTTGARVAIHADDAPLLHRPPVFLRAFGSSAPPELVVDRALADGDLIALGDVALEVLHTPGHSPGGISLWQREAQVVFGGDTLFREGLGRTDFPGCSHKVLVDSITRHLLTLPDETVVYPGHGPSTTIGHERRHNPWLPSR